MKKINDKLKQKIWISTSKCYCKALAEHYPDVFKDMKRTAFNKHGCDYEMRKTLYDNGLESRTPEIHRLYMKYVLELTTKELELIIEADRQGVIKRAPYTIDEIVYELLDRSINGPETKEKHESKENSANVRSVKPTVRRNKRTGTPKRSR